MPTAASEDVLVVRAMVVHGIQVDLGAVSAAIILMVLTGAALYRFITRVKERKHVAP